MESTRKVTVRIFRRFALERMVLHVSHFKFNQFQFIPNKRNDEIVLIEANKHFNAPFSLWTTEISEEFW